MGESIEDFESIYQEFQPKLYRYLSNLVGENDAPDLTQSVLLKVSHSLEGFRGESSLATWIYRIATNTAMIISFHRCQTREKEVLYEDAASLDELPDSDSPGTDQEYIRRK